MIDSTAKSSGRWLTLAVCCALSACTNPEPEHETESLPVPLETVTTTDAPSESAPPWEADDVRSAFSLGGSYLIKWRPVNGSVPKNAHFEIDLWIFEAPELTPVDGAKVGVAGWMPDHGHGMIRQPQAKSLGDGYYSVTGVLFHMGGEWQLFFDLIVDGVSERTVFDVNL